MITTDRRIKVSEIRAGETVSYKTTITIGLRNETNESLVGVKVVEVVPKAVAENTELIESDALFSVLKEDPVIEFAVDWLEANGTTEIQYSVNKKIEENALTDWIAPIATSFQQATAGVCVSDSDCDDKNPCTVNRCLNNKCSSLPMPDGTTCGYGRECRQAKCVATSKIVAAVEQATGVDVYMPVSYTHLTLPTN